MIHDHHLLPPDIKIESGIGLKFQQKSSIKKQKTRDKSTHIFKYSLMILVNEFIHKTSTETLDRKKPFRLISKDEKITLNFGSSKNNRYRRKGNIDNKFVITDPKPESA